jgi:tRNA-splicing ligase RtcB (3'-phosphate/5'-hydroxy nucleic acid ligase)
MEIIEQTPYRFLIPQQGPMRVPGIVCASKALLPALTGDRSLEQVANVATLPGIVEASYGMPDMHWGYGFPIGGVAATDPAQEGVVSPGGVGFDISCGVRLLGSDLHRGELEPVLGRIMDRFAAVIPTGAGRGGLWRLRDAGQLRRVLTGGARFAADQGFGEERDLLRCEDQGAVDDADPEQVSSRAMERGLHQVGSLGSGNHFLEVQAVDAIFDAGAARCFGLREGQVCVMIHCGSRGMGHQICTDHVRSMEKAMARYGISVPDRQLACAPVTSPEGQSYLAAMAAAANYGRANRHVLADAARAIFRQTASAGLHLTYDVSHNLAKMETHVVDGQPTRLCVHRKGATRALPPGHPELPPDLRDHGQPVLIPGSMGTSSYVLAGVPGGGAFASTCHGAGRVMSRHQALRSVTGEQLRRRLVEAGIAVRGASQRGLAEETPEAYKDVDAVVDAAEGAGLCRKVARLVPLGVVKGLCPPSDVYGHRARPAPWLVLRAAHSRQGGGLWRRAGDLHRAEICQPQREVDSLVGGLTCLNSHRDLALGVHAVDDLVDSRDDQIGIAVAGDVALGRKSGLSRTGEGVGETFHQRADGLGHALFPRGRPCLNAQVRRVRHIPVPGWVRRCRSSLLLH